MTSAQRPGANTLEIEVINLWVNRLIGDQQPNVAKKYTYTAQQFYRADSRMSLVGFDRVFQDADERELARGLVGKVVPLVIRY